LLSAQLEHRNGSGWISDVRLSGRGGGALGIFLFATTSTPGTTSIIASGCQGFFVPGEHQLMREANHTPLSIADVRPEE
jgi:hypothetical protein